MGRVGGMTRARKGRLGDIVPIGCSGNLVEIFDELHERAGIPAILDDAGRQFGESFRGIPVRPLSCSGEYPEAKFLLMIGSAKSFRARKDILAAHALGPERFATFLHRKAEVSGHATVESGAVLNSGVMVNPNVHVGKHVLVLPRTILHHDSSVGDYSVVGAGVILAGGARIGEGCYIGSGSLVRDGVTIGDGALVGMGSVVVRDVAPYTTVAGNPARGLRPRAD